MKVWGMLKTEDRITADIVLSHDEFLGALSDVCDHFDLTKPIICAKHLSEIKNFRRTTFYADDFVEAIRFDTLEIEIIDIKKQA